MALRDYASHVKPHSSKVDTDPYHGTRRSAYLHRKTVYLYRKIMFVYKRTFSIIIIMIILLINAFKKIDSIKVYKILKHLLLYSRFSYFLDSRFSYS